MGKTMTDERERKPRHFIQGKHRKIILSVRDGVVRETCHDTIIVGKVKPTLNTDRTLVADRG
jgi:hypothetical protein